MSSENEIREQGEYPMGAIIEPAKLFFGACETGLGWEGCKAYSHPDATFSAQAGALAGVTTLEGYSEWMKQLFTRVSDAYYELRFLAVDQPRNSALCFMEGKTTLHP